DIHVLEPTAIAYESIMELSKALELEQRLFSISGDPRWKLKTAGILFAQNNVEAARADIQWVIDNKQVTDTIVVEQPQPSDQNKIQKVKIRALAYYMLGELEMRMENRKAAIRYFNKALEVDGHYDMAAMA